MPAPILAHIHLRKCGGTAFAQLLSRHFGARHLSLYADDVYFAYSVPELEEALRAGGDVAAFSSHHVRRFPPMLAGRPVLYVTFLRDPVRQSISYMTHVRKHYEEFTEPSLLGSLPPDAPRLSLREFARWILTREQEVLFRENYDVDFFTRYEAGAGGRLLRAKEVLNSFFLVGITEHMEDSVRKLRMLADGAAVEFPAAPLRVVNASSEAGDDLDWIHPEDEVGAMLLDSLCQDRQLYQWALRRSGEARCCGDAHPVRLLVEVLVREGVPGEFRAAGADQVEAAITLRRMAPGRPREKRIALLWLAGDAGPLRATYPKMVAGGYVVADQYRADERCRAAVDEFRREWDIRAPLEPIGAAGVYWRVSEAMPATRGAELPPIAEINALLQVYAARPDLQDAFPEAAGGELQRLVCWASHAVHGDFADSSVDTLRPHTGWYALNCVEDFWPLLLDSASALPETFRHQRADGHLITLALLIIECNLKEVVEVGCGGGSALEEAVRQVGGTVRRQAAGAIDLLYLDSLALYSQTLAELQAFGPYLHDGSWIALRQAVASPGATKALLEALESFGWNARLYPFLRDGGLLLARIST